MSQPPFYVLSEGQKTQFCSHDTSRAGFHHQDLAAFSEDVNNAAKRAFPNRGKSRYETVNICLIRWEDDELGVQEELRALNNIFQGYGFQTNVFLIPGTNSHWDLMRKTLDFIQAYDSDQNLFVLYYAGHGRMNSARQAEWVFGQNPDSPFVDWSAIQGLFGSAKSDVLILLDTCAAASSATTSQFAVMETIAACGFERRAPPPGEHSLTNTRVDVLRDWISKPSFSAASLHTEILFRLKLKEAKKGREGIPLEWCVTPIHWINTKDCKASGIELCRRDPSTSLSGTPSAATSDEDDASTYVDAMDLDFDDKSSSSTPLSSVSSDGSYKVPHVLITLQLEENQPLDASQCARWLDKFPLLAKWVKVEAVFPSHSTLMILSVPMPIWDMLPDHPACSFIGYATGPNIRSPETFLINDCTTRNTLSQGIGDTAQEEHRNFEVPLRMGKVESVVIKKEFQESSDWKSRHLKDEQLPNKSDLLSMEITSMKDFRSSGVESCDEEAQSKLGEWTPFQSVPDPGSWVAPDKEPVATEGLDEIRQHKNPLSNYETTSPESDPKRARVNKTSNATKKGKSTMTVASPIKRKPVRPKRTGCLNCKTRRMKCDETRPQCIKCVRSGQQCDGYTPGRPMLDASTATLSGKKTNATIIPLVPGMHGASQLPFDSLEGQYFQSFQTFTTRDLFGFSDSQFWTSTILQECHSDASIRHAVLAMGGLYETLGGKLTPHYDFALKQYGKALAKLRENLKSEETRSNRKILMSIALFVCFQSFNGDHEAAISQLKHGIRIIKEPLHHDGIDDEIVQIFARLFIQIKSCDEAFHFPQAMHLSIIRSTTNPFLPNSSFEAALDALTIPTMFTTTEESRHFLHQLQILTTHYKDTFYMSRAKSNAEVSVPALRHVTSLRTQHMAWSIAFESLLESRQQPEVSNMERTKRAILKMNNLSIAVLLPDVLSIGETGFDSSYLNFTRIVALAKEVLVDEELFLNHGMYGNATDQRSTKVPKIGIEHSSLLSPTTHGQVSQQEKYMPMGTPQSRLDSTAPTSMNYPNSPVHVRASFTTSLGIVYPLYVVATKCRNRELRREAIRLLLSSPRREGLWDSLLSGQVAQWVMEIEEEGLAAWDSSRAENAALDLRWIAEDKRVVVREVLFDLQHRTAKCRCGTSGVGEGEPDERARETTLKW